MNGTNSTENASSSIADEDYDVDLIGVPRHPIQIEIVISAFLWSVTFFIIAGNVLVFVSFAKDPKLLTGVQNLLILNLASADLMVGACMIFCNLLRYYDNWPFGEGICRLQLLLDYTSTSQSTCTIILLSLDRYLIVKMKLKYNTFMTRRKAIFSILVTWGLSLMMFMPLIGETFWGPTTWVDYSVTCDAAVLYNASYHVILLTVFIVIPIVLLTYFNVVVFLDIRTRSRGLPPRKYSNRIEATPLPLVSVIAPPQATAAQRRIQIVKPVVRRRNSQRDRTASIRLIVIVVLYMICWLPYCITHLVYTLYAEFEISTMLLVSVYYLVWFNSAINPCIYAIGHRRIRTSMQKLICFW